MKIKSKILGVGITALALSCFGIANVNRISSPTVQATTYKYADRFYKVKLLQNVTAWKIGQPLMSSGQTIYKEKKLPMGTILYIKSNTGNESWSVKSNKLSGNYWVLNFNTQDYSWFTTNMAVTPILTTVVHPSIQSHITYSKHGTTVRQARNSISLSNKHGKLVIYTNTIKLYHIRSGSESHNEMYVNAKFTNKSHSEKMADDFVDYYFVVKRINSATTNTMDMGAGSSMSPNENIFNLRKMAKTNVLPHKTIHCVLSSDVGAGWHNCQKFRFQPVNDYGKHLGPAKYARGGQIHYCSDEYYR